MRNKDEIASITNGTGREWQRNNVGTRFLDGAQDAYGN